MRRRRRARRRPPRPPRARWDSTSAGCSSRHSTSDRTSRAYRSLDIAAGSVVDDAARVSLADLLVGLAMFAVVGAAAFTLLDEGRRAWAFGMARAETQQSARVALARLSAELRVAGRGGRNFDAVALAAPDTIVLQQDLDGDGIIAANGERVTWRPVGTVLPRDAGGGLQPIVNGVRSLRLTYFDAAGVPTLAPAAVRSPAVPLASRPDSSVVRPTLA